MLITEIRFSNYRLLKDAALPLGRLTILIGANGTGKTTALNAVDMAQHFSAIKREMVLPIDMKMTKEFMAKIAMKWDDGSQTVFSFGERGEVTSNGTPHAQEAKKLALASSRVFSLVPESIAATVSLTKTLEIQRSGAGLPAVLTNLQDQYPERFDAFNNDLRQWMPEFDRLLFDTPQQGHRAIMLRTKIGGYLVPASKLSQGTLLSLAMLMLCHLPNPPAMIGLEDVERGIHPRLLRDVRDSLLRLTNPEDFGESRPPTQVIVTTHSPYLIDLFRDQPEDIVLADKVGLFTKFTRLADLPNIEEILAGSRLGDLWYSGVLGGVPALP